LTVATIALFRTYPAPGSSWKRWQVSLDGKAVDHIGGAGCRLISAEPGHHDIQVSSGGSQSEALSLDLQADQMTMVLVGLGVRDDQGVGRQRIGIKECSNATELPLCAIPMHAPGGNDQSFVDGRTKAVVALAVALMLALVFLVLAVLSFAGALSNSDPFRFVAGIVGLVLGLWIGFKMWPGIRIVRNQWSWPLETLRIQRKGDERDQWERWQA
jgi:hypothetical protein